MREERLWRYLAPNIITAISMLFGLASIVAAMEGRYVAAGWWIIYAVLSDRLDGLVARLVRGTSELGVQLDSLADFLNFGVAPAVLIFASLGREASLPFAAGAGRVVLLAACATWMLGAVFRLARYNVSTAADVPKSLFFGIPTTLAAGTLAMWYLALLKYTEVGHVMSVEAFGGARLFPGFETPQAIWRYLPLFLFAGGILMGSNLRIPKLGNMGSRLFTAFVFANVLLGFVLAPAQLYPEYLIWPPTAWIIIFTIWGQVSEKARALKAPPIFPHVPVEPEPEESLFESDEDEPTTLSET